MTIKFQTESDIKRDSVYFIAPEDIIAEQGQNGRWMPHTEDAVRRRCESYEREGQITPVTVRKDHEGKPKLVLGFCRHAAAMLYNKRHPDSPMKLKCVHATLNDEEAFKKNVIENQEVERTTPVDDAFNMRRFREDYGWSDKQIAEFYGVSSSYVSQLNKLLTLPKETILLVHTKLLTLGAALDLAGLSREDQAEVLEAAKTNHVVAGEDTPDVLANGNGRLKSSKVRAAVRDKAIDKGKKKSRTLREVKEFFEGQVEEKTDLSDLSEIVLSYIKGKIKDKTFADKLTNLIWEGK